MIVIRADIRSSVISMKDIVCVLARFDSFVALRVYNSEPRPNFGSRATARVGPRQFCWNLEYFSSVTSGF